MFVRIDNEPRDYAWGDRGLIADFRGREASGAPEAELWLGAHPGSPSRILGGEPPFADLGAWIGAEPDRALGSSVAARFADEGMPRLPFLLKLLAAGGPLSLQAHPTTERARIGFAREEADGVPIGAYDRNYRDRFHKPELVVALSETFDALSGFRPLEEVDGVLEALRAADAASPEPQPGAIGLLLDRLAADGLAGTVEWLLTDGRGGDTGESAWLIERVVALADSAAVLASPYAESFRTVGALAETYPGDPGIVISLLLNRVRLARGESLFLAAGNIHAYLGGLGIELMAASDNVLRGGLTPKHIDLAELVEVLDFTPMPPPRLEPERPAPGVRSFRPPVPDFVLHRLEAAVDGRQPEVAIDGPAIVLAEGGSVRLVGAEGGVELGRGEAAFVTPDERYLRLAGAGAGAGTGADAVWVATTG
ncbi:mannose-6-phosphate isomerase, class I [Agromyces mediolanus]|uniref:mannose-6-phosphate isomerase, class I n=1 Tax=Agromyces mediolanus TaxID=41986 RepID=UPI00203ED645|nr:mannose-6-phosphate isomerase, class I [Agromyces mediolanus]MCM3656549.1 mannose-6-phosphate isomerase, class I [Agromyces mediolanus]